MVMKPCFLGVSRRIQLKKKSGKNRKIPTLLTTIKQAFYTAAQTARAAAVW
jgi:hypothetical protein